MYYRVGGLAGQNATSTAQGRERHTGYTLHPDSILEDKVELLLSLRINVIEE